MAEKIKGAVSKLKEEPCVYANKEQKILFDRALHKKYNAAIYFADEVKGIVHVKDAIQEETPGKKAYDNFVESLEMTGQQEYVTRGHTKKPRNDEEKQAVLKIAKEQLGIDEKGLDGSDWQPNELAAWERQIKQRHFATKAASYKARLRERSFQFNKDKFKVGSEKAEPKWGNCKLPPIRRQTYKILSAPPEKDFNLMMAVLSLITIFTYVYNLVTQIEAITSVCSSSWICPFNSVTSRLPIVAPPAAFRTALPEQTIYSSDTGIYYPSVWPKCKPGNAGCNDPGYVVQWPYVQLGESPTPVVPPEIASACPRVSGGEMGWMLDPYNEVVLSEYYDCSGQDRNIPFVASAFSSKTDGTLDSAMHFDTDWYKEANVQTIECMQEAIDREVVPIKAVSQWSTLSFSDRENGNEVVSTCVDKKESLRDRLGYCKCSEDNNDWTNFPFHEFYTDRETRSCVGGTRAGELCNGPANCPQGSCESSFWDQKPIEVSEKYGCWFDGPGSSAQLQADIGLCGFAVWRQFFFESSPASKRQVALETNWFPSVSTRMALVLIFLVKEGGYITAVILNSMLIVVIWIAKAVLALLFAPVYYFLVRPIPFRVRTAKALYKKIDNSIERQVDVIWTMCVNLSTSWRILVVVWSFLRGLVNASVKDFNTKLISVANLLYTLTLIFVTGGSPDGQLVSATALSLFLLLHKMNKESLELSNIAAGFRCLNENRLTKFEMSLFLVKVMEKLLDDDVHYCWVENMIGEPDFKPDVHDDPEVHPKALEQEPKDYITNGTSFLGQDVGERGLDIAVEGEYARDSIKLPHEKKFGNDGLGMYHKSYMKSGGDERYLSQLKAVSGSMVLTRMLNKNRGKGGSAPARKTSIGGSSLPKKGLTPPVHPGTNGMHRGHDHMGNGHGTIVYGINGHGMNGHGTGHPAMQTYEPTFAPPFAPRPSGMEGFYQPSVSPYQQQFSPPMMPFGGSPGFGV